MITPAHVQHEFAHHGLTLARYAKAPEICDRRSCNALEYWGGPKAVFLAAGSRTDFIVVVLPTLGAAGAVASLYRRSPTLTAERRQNVLLVYLRAATQRLAIVRTIFEHA